MARPMPSTSTRAISVWSTLPSTWPISTEAREIAMVRNRAMMPSVMSVATDTAVPSEVMLTVSRRMPGTR